MTDPSLPRGIRNNNPGNIVRTDNDHWLHMAVNQPDPRFLVFNAAEDGIRAMTRILLNYQRLDHLRTLRQIISRWAPSTENDTGAYLAHVAAIVGANPDDVIDLNGLPILKALCRAIIAHENADYAYPDDVLGRGVALALYGADTAHV